MLRHNEGGYNNLSIPKTEAEYKSLQDKFYRQTKESLEKNESPKFKGLLEIIKSDAVIITAIHKLKANKGSKTPGSDGIIMEDILVKDYREVVKGVKWKLDNYKALPVKRKLIPKSGKRGEFRPLGIPAVIDRVIQELIRGVIEPIMEAQFYDHSYGFRPMREAGQAVEYLNLIMARSGFTWCVEGDISKFFDEVNHRILLKTLWSMGIRDKRILMIIKEMLEAGIMNECSKNGLGTPQGGIISPLLANVYLHRMDMWITREWYNKKTRKSFVNQSSKIATLKHHSTLKPAYLIRYADDWVVVCRSKTDAEKWKYRIGKYLDNTLKLRLSEEKTLITNARKRPLEFLGFKIKMLSNRGRANHNILPKVSPNEERLDLKVLELRKQLRKLKYAKDKEFLINDINLINSQIRGIINYYSAADGVNEILRKYKETLKYASYKALKKYGAKWTPANKTDNLKEIHEERTEKIPAIEYVVPKRIPKKHITEKDKITVGITSIAFAKWQMVPKKKLTESPYTADGREHYYKRSKKKASLHRADSIFNDIQSVLIAYDTKSKIYNFEYLMNRGYTFNRDKGKCRCCSEFVSGDTVNIHHIKPYLPMNEINKVANLATTCKKCHKLIHSKNELTGMPPIVAKRIESFRVKLVKQIA